MKHATPLSPARRPRRGQGLMLAAVGLLLWQAWAGCRTVQRRRAGQPAAKPGAEQRWEDEGGQPLPDPPPT